MISKVLFAIAFVAALAAIPSGAAYAQCPSSQGVVPGLCVYSVKFVCGLQQPNPQLIPPSETPVKPGNYATAVNLHNFHNNRDVVIRKKAVIANSENQQPGLISPFKTLVLIPDQALEIDCPDIVALLSASGTSLPPFIKGFVEIQSSQTLSVTGVYTAEPCVPSPVPGVCAPGPVSISVTPVTPFAGP
jgi:hypothetical protein